MTVDELLADARRRLERVDAPTAREAFDSGATLVDIRTDAQIADDGAIPGALRIGRNVLEWRLDPACEYRDPGAPALDAHVIVFCDSGYASSFAAASLQQLGFARATDLDGGFQAWRSAGFPVERDGNTG
jgi:rhodanese-related sulfurtransferase